MWMWSGVYSSPSRPTTPPAPPRASHPLAGAEAGGAHFRHGRSWTDRSAQGAASTEPHMRGGLDECETAKTTALLPRSASIIAAGELAAAARGPFEAEPPCSRALVLFLPFSWE